MKRSITGVLEMVVLLAVLGCCCTESYQVDELRRRGGRSRQRSVNNGNQTTRSPYDQNWTQLRHGSSTGGDIEYRLQRLESILIEKLENVRAEVRETSRRLQALELHSSDAQSTIDYLRNDINRMAQQRQSDQQEFQRQEEITPKELDEPDRNLNEQLQLRVDNLANGIQLLVSATKLLTADINTLKNNISFLIDTTISRNNPNVINKPQHSSFGDVSNSLDNSQPGQNPRSCREIQASGETRSGIYRIQPSPTDKPFMAVCDLETNGGSWTVIQNRFDGSQDFYVPRVAYQHGFGNLEGEFWLGLEKIHQLTDFEINELLIELQDWDNQNKTATYISFALGNNFEGYALKVLGGYMGDACDSLTYHAGSRFSAYDADEDNWSEGNCAEAHHGGWWYKNCDKSNLNGKYLGSVVSDQDIYQGMYWSDFRGPQYSLKRSRMLIRPKINDRDILNIFTANPQNV